MRLGLALAAAVLATAACVGIDHGYVTSKRDVPAHDQSYVKQVWVGQSCRTTKSGKTNTTSCTPSYIYVPATRHVDRACYVSLQNDKDSGERSVSCDSWDGMKTNDYVTLK